MSLRYLHFSTLLPLISPYHGIAAKCNQRGGLLLGSAVLELFLVHKTFLSLHKVSGSHKNSYRKLRVHTFRSQILINDFNYIAIESLVATLGKVITFYLVNLRGGARFLCAENVFPRIKSVPPPLKLTK